MGFCPEGPGPQRSWGGYQPRASPWDHEVQPNSSPERAAQGPEVVSPFQGSGQHSTGSQGVALG